MNERLKELMLEAGYAAPEMAGRANKLAELIIKECVDAVTDFDMPTTASIRIKRHFGVE